MKVLDPRDFKSAEEFNEAQDREAFLFQIETVGVWFFGTVLIIVLYLLRLL